jgi:hypothetical protein
MKKLVVLSGTLCVLMGKHAGSIKPRSTPVAARSHWLFARPMRTSGGILAGVERKSAGRLLGRRQSAKDDQSE